MFGDVASPVVLSVGAEMLGVEIVSLPLYQPLYDVSFAAVLIYILSL